MAHEVKIVFKALGEVAFEAQLQLGDEGGIDRVTIGTGPNADIVLPRAAFRRLARIEFELSLSDGGLWMQHMGTPRCCLVDGAPFTKDRLIAGSHALDIEGDCFELSVGAGSTG